MADVQAIGDRVLWLDAGRAKELGAADDVINKYMAAMVDKDNAYVTGHRPAPAPAGAPATVPDIIEKIPNIDHRFGDRRAEIIGIAVFDPSGNPVHILQPSSHIIVRISVRAYDEIAQPIVGFIMRNHMGLDFAGTNTAREDFEFPPLASGDVRTIDFHIQLPDFYPSAFAFSPAIADGTLESNTVCDWIDNALVLQMSPAKVKFTDMCTCPAAWS